MEVKSVYMDLQEGKKKGSVWKLESEAFKKPIEIKIGYEDKELQTFNNKIGELKADINNKDAKIHELEVKLDATKKLLQDYGLSLNDWQLNVGDMEDMIGNQIIKIENLYKVIADIKTTVETLSGTIIHLQDKTKQISQKITKQPTVIYDKCFISGRESSGLGVIDIADGDYLMIAKYAIGEHNEYVENKDEILMDKIHIEGQHYVPFYKLEGGTELDTPTATIYYNLVFIPI